VGAQIALSLVLLTNAGLLVRTLQAIRSIDSGMRAQDVFVAYPAPGPEGYGRTDNDSYYPQVVGRLEAIPGVRRVSVSLFKPAGGGTGGGERASSTRSAPDGPSAASLFIAVSPAFFDTLDVPLRSGRDFAWGDNSRAARVAVVSETLARHLFPNGAIGEHLRIGVAPAHQNLEVVGIVADAHLYDLKDPNLSAVYVPALQEPDPNGKCFVIRARGVSLADLNRAVEPLGLERVGSVQALAAITDRALLQERLTAAVSAFFGGVALLLAAIGLYGLLSYGVQQRQKEIGIRMALGAEPQRILTAFVREALVVALGGVAAGLTAALFSVRLVKSLLFGITPTDPTALAAAILSLVAIAIIGALLPAARAARVDPVTALRAE
jgi:predicted permease